MNRFNYFSLTSKESNFIPNEGFIKIGNIRLNTVEIGEYKIFCSNNVKCLISNGLHCFVLGDIYNFNSDDDIFSVYKDVNNIKELDGFFTLIFIQNNSVKIISDQVCLYPIYYDYNDQLILSTIAYEIASFKNLHPNIDEINIFLSTGKTLPGNTIYKNLFSLKPETVLTFGNNSIREYNYGNDGDFLDLNITIDTITEDLKQIIKSGYSYLKNLKGCNNILCDLSGGSDSRLTTLLAFVFFKKINIFTGDSGSISETKKEKEIANKINIKCLNNSRRLKRVSLQEDADDKVCNLVAGCDDSFATKKKYLVDKFEGKKYDVKIGGQAGEIFKDFWIKNIFPRNRLYKTGLSKKDLDFLIHTRFLHKKPIINSYDDTKNYIIKHIENNINFNLRADKIIDQIYIKYYTRPIVYSLKQVGDIFYSIWPPFLTNKYILYCRKVNPKHRYYENIHSHMIFSISKLCSSIATDRSVFGIYPFKLVPKNIFNLPYYIFLEFSYNLQRLVLKTMKLFQRFSKHNKSSIPQTIYNGEAKINKTIVKNIPNIIELKDENLIATLNFHFDYLDKSYPDRNE